MPRHLLEIDRWSLPAHGRDLRTTIRKPSHFPSPFDQVADGEYRFVTRAGGRQVGCLVRYPGPALAAEFHLFLPEGDSPPEPTGLRHELARRLGLALDVPGYDELWDRDPILARLPTDMRGARPSTPFSLYEYLVICTLLQNTTVRRTVQMANALAEGFGTALRFPDGTVLSGFWEPATLVEAGEARLRELRLGYRAKALVRISEQFAADPGLEASLLATAADAQRLRRNVLTIYGVGPASAGYLLFDWFKCVDELHHVSPWELRILSQLLFGHQQARAGELIEFCRYRWAPYTMLAAHAVFEAIFWQRLRGDQAADWLDELICL